MDLDARAKLYLREAAHDCDGDPLFKTLWRIAERSEPVTGVEDDYEGVERAYFIKTGERILP